MKIRCQGRLLMEPTEALEASVNKYLKLLEGAGSEIAYSLKFSEETQQLLKKGFTLSR